MTPARRDCCTTCEHDPCATHGHQMEYADGQPGDTCTTCGATWEQITTTTEAAEARDAKWTASWASTTGTTRIP